MNVSLTVELENYVHAKVESGLYGSASEVMREALRLLRERDKLMALRQDLAVGAADIEAGRVEVFDEAVVERVKREGRARLEQQGRKKGA